MQELNLRLSGYEPNISDGKPREKQYIANVSPQDIELKPLSVSLNLVSGIMATFKQIELF